MAINIGTVDPEVINTEAPAELVANSVSATTLLTIGAVIGIALIIISIFVFAGVFKLMATNAKQTLTYKRALLYSLAFTIVNSIGQYLGSYALEEGIILQVGGSILGGIAVFLLGKYSFKDTYINGLFILKAIIAYILIFIILGFIIALLGFAVF